MKTSNITKIAEELNKLYVKHDGLNPATVVNWARNNPDSELHKRFDWDDTSAAEKHRLWQARQIIVEVKVTYQDNKERQVYVSPLITRNETGYQKLVTVLSDDELRNCFLNQALAEYERVGEKYADLLELAGVREAVAVAKAEVQKARASGGGGGSKPADSRWKKRAAAKAEQKEASQGLA